MNDIHIYLFHYIDCLVFNFHLRIFIQRKNTQKLLYFYNNFFCNHFICFLYWWNHCILKIILAIGMITGLERIIFYSNKNCILLDKLYSFIISSYFCIYILLCCETFCVYVTMYMWLCVCICVVLCCQSLKLMYIVPCWNEVLFVSSFIDLFSRIDRLSLSSFQFN